MPEHLPHNGHTQDQDPYTYEDVLSDHPDMHPHLRSHVERLAASQEMHGPDDVFEDSGLIEFTIPDSSPEEHQSTSVATLAQELQEDVKRLEESDLHDVEIYGVRDPGDSFRKTEYTDEQLADYVEGLLLVESKVKERFAALGGEGEMFAGGIAKLRFAKVPSDRLHTLYISEKGAMLRELLADAHHPGEIHHAITIMKKVYSFPGSDLEFMARDGNYITDPVVAALHTKTNLPQALISETLSDFTGIGESGTHTPEEISKEQRRWGDQYLRTVTDLPEAALDELQFASFQRTMDQDTGQVNRDSLRNMLLTNAETARALGKEKVAKLREEAGIVDLSYANLEQLELMSKLIDGDQETIQHLQAGDVTVLFTDTKGDHNGAMLYAAERYATPNGRTLPFQINRPVDFFRQLSLLSRRGIRPSTIALANHGFVGYSAFGQGKESFSIVNTELDASTRKQGNTFSYAEMKSIPVIVNKYMQDSRGIDEPEESRGRRRIVLDSCAQASRAPVERTVKVREKSRLKRFARAILGRTVDNEYIEYSDESQAETIALQAKNPNVDVYAGWDTLYSGSTDRGIRFTHDVNGVREELPIYKITTDMNGNLVQEEISELVLRADPGKKKETQHA